MHLPAELIYAIVEQAYYTQMGSPDYTLLARCSLVCRAWSAPAQSLLFAKTRTLTATTASIFNVVLRSPRPARPLGQLVRSLDVAIGGPDTTLYCAPGLLATLLEACPHVYALALSTYGLHALDAFARAALKHAGQALRALHLRETGVQSPLVFQLLGIWPRLRFLTIGSEIAATPPRPPAHAALYELALSRIPPQPVLEWLLAPSTASLRILELREIPGPAARAALAPIVPRLRSLRLLHLTLDAAALLRACTALEELVLHSIPVLVPLAPDVPPTLEHLSFGNPPHASRHTLRPILDAIDVLPRLRILTCDRRSERLRDFAALRAQCVQRGIDVVISDVPLWVYEDPVVVHRFPRRRSVSNLALMTGGD